MLTCTMVLWLLHCAKQSCGPTNIEFMRAPISFKYFFMHYGLFFIVPHPPPCGFCLLNILHAKPKSFLNGVPHGHASFKYSHISYIAFQSFHVPFHWVHPSSVNWSTNVELFYKMDYQMCHNVKA